MDEDDVSVRAHDLQAVPDGILPFLATRNDTTVRQRVDGRGGFQELECFFFLALPDDDNTFADVLDLGELPQGMHEDWLLCEHEEDFVVMSLHPPSLSGGGNDHADHIGIPSFLFVPVDMNGYDFGFAKIMRPAAVCSALVTSTVMVSPM